MILDARNVPDGTRLDADVCIVGAGAAGITLARRLTHEHLTICLLESGGLEYDEATQALYKGSISGRPYHDLDVARLRFFGGTTNHWSGWCTPLDPIDFEARPYLPSAGWRIRHGDLDEHYRQAAAVCQLPRSSFRVEDHQPDLPDLFLQPLDSYGLSGRVWQVSPPTRFGEVYGPDLEKARTLRCFLGANVVAIEIGDGDGLVSGLQVKTLAGTGFSVAAKAYVLAAGGIENARLLLQPTDRRPNGIGNSGDQVGRCFMLHPMVPIGTVLAAGRNGALLRTRSEDVIGGLRLSSAEQLRLQLPNHVVNVLPGRPSWVAPAAFETFKRRIRRPFADTPVLLEDVKFVLGDLDEIGGYAYDRVSQRLSGLLGRDEAAPDVYTALLRMEHAPNPANRITLVEERDPLGTLRVGLDWTFSAGENEGIRVTAVRFGEILGALSIGRFRLTEWLRDDDPSFPNWIDGDYHHMGTTRMSDGPATGVVDWDCRVHEAPNLYVAGSSVFPTGGSSNPTLTIVAMTLRLAERILDDLSRPLQVRALDAFDKSGAVTVID